ncbi:MAG TPA: hypothetical protein VHY20_02570 [Pirellulales bacterium]|jgi:hypothetical protein|nr:hypothetical protein [Pirellulales bacterium]
MSMIWKQHRAEALRAIEPGEREFIPECGEIKVVFDFDPASVDPNAARLIDVLLAEERLGVDWPLGHDGAK